jgi:hypothetical protein
MTSASSKPPGYAVASLVMGTTGFTVTIYGLAVSAFEIFTSATSLGKDTSVLQAQLLIQEQLLQRWGDGLGLTKGEDELDDRLKTETRLFLAVVAALSAIKNMLLDIDKLITRYGIQNSKDLSSDSLISELRSTQLLEGEALLREHNKRTEDAEKTQKTIGIMKKLRWAIVDKEKFETLISEVSKIINGLYSLISPMDARILAKAVAGELLRTTNLQRVLDIRSAAQGTRLDVAALATRRRRALLSALKGQSVPKMTLPGGHKSLSESKTADTGNRTVAVYKDEEGIAKNVMVEWKALPATAPDREKSLVDQRLNKLAYFLHQEEEDRDTEVLQCVGIVNVGQLEDQIKVGLVFELPTFTSSGSLPLCLSEILPTDDDSDPSDELDLGDKFRLAQVLSQALYSIHISNWLHKSICSANVVSFARGKRSKNTKFSVSSTFLTGYELARPSGLSEVTMGPQGHALNLYAHPAYRSGNVRYCRLFDIYSLGVILLEIGLWRRVDSDLNVRQSPNRVKEMLVQACKEELGPAMGVNYREAVRCCLEGDFSVQGLSIPTGQEPDWETMSEEEVAKAEAADERLNGDLSEAFYWKVLSPLAKLYA